MNTAYTLTLLPRPTAMIGQHGGDRITIRTAPGENVFAARDRLFGIAGRRGATVIRAA